AQLDKDRTATVGKCHLKGKVDGGQLELQAQFSFVTERDRSVVSVGCSQAHPNRVLLDGNLPILWRGDDGITVQVEKKGEHQVTVDLGLSLKRGVGAADRSFEIDLPRAPITTVELELPSGVKELRVNGQPIKEPLTLKNNVLSGPLGALARLELAWAGAPTTM